jgi:predicted membrane-bound spermidine synthase
MGLYPRLAAARLHAADQLPPADALPECRHHARNVHFPPDMQPMPMAPNRLNTQSLVHEFEQDWRRVIR